MARARKKASSGGRRSGKKASAASAAKAAPVAEVEVIEESKGLGIDEGIVIITTIALLVATLMVDAHLAVYGEGSFF